MTASITDSLVTLATHVINDLGYFGVWLMTMTTGVIGLPGTEPTMLFAGFNVSEPPPVDDGDNHRWTRSAT